MNILSLAFQKILYQPFLNLLIIFYQYIPPYDFGISILILTTLLRIILWPLNSKAIKGQMESQQASTELQEKMKGVREEFKNDSIRQSEEMMKIWKEKKFNPFASFVPLIIQVIILIAFYQVLRGLVGTEQITLLYHFVPNPGNINPSFLGLIDLSKASPILAILTGISQYFYSKISLKLQPGKKLKKNAKDDKTVKMQKMMQNQMIYFMPLFTVFICFSLPAALPLYWLLSTLFGIVQYKMVGNQL